MPESNKIHVWQCDITLHDYFFFATTKRGKISETGNFVHNYSLTYALGWAKSEWRANKHEPQYEGQLANVDGIYITPGHLIAGSHTLMSRRANMDGYRLSANESLRDNNCNILRCFRPGSVFRFHVIARFYLDSIPPLVRLGRFMAKAEIMAEYSEKIEINEGDLVAPSLLNWNDIAIKPKLCDVIVYALPGRLIQNARFANTRYLKAEFVNGSEANLPLEMGYFQRDLCSSWLNDAA